MCQKRTTILLYKSWKVSGWWMLLFLWCWCWFCTKFSYGFIPKSQIFPWSMRYMSVSIKCHFCRHCLYYETWRLYHLRARITKMTLLLVHLKITFIRIRQDSAIHLLKSIQPHMPTYIDILIRRRKFVTYKIYLCHGHIHFFA